ncbi:hypothetical protein HK102_001559 [Quaeritorhiza haematococci]|nr:hypothetical protein HK102_001559 [Quaeritorhiza haematococci]
MRQSHLTCTESFYKDNVVAELQAKSGRQVDEGQVKREMMEMLRRFEVENESGLGIDSDDEEEEEDDSASPEELLQRLTDKERTAFQAALASGNLTEIISGENGPSLPPSRPSNQGTISPASGTSRTLPSSGATSVAPQQRVVAAEQGLPGAVLWLPWWLRPAKDSHLNILRQQHQTRRNRLVQEVGQREPVKNEEQDRQVEGGEDSREEKEGAEVPAIPFHDIPPLQSITKTNPNPSVAYNLVDVLFAYAFTIRHFNGEIHLDNQNSIESCHVIWELSKVLSSTTPSTTASASSKTTDTTRTPTAAATGPQKQQHKRFAAYESTAEVVASLKTHFLEQHRHSPTLASLSFILRDVTRILSSRTYTLAALCDLHSLLARVAGTSTPNAGSRSVATAKEKIPKAIRHRAFLSERKLWFYICWVAAQSPSDLTTPREDVSDHNEDRNSSVSFTERLLYTLRTQLEAECDALEIELETLKRDVERVGAEGLREMTRRAEEGMLIQEVS